jgi:hypothetical protein
MEKKDWRTKIGSILNNNRVDILDKDGSELLNDLEELFNQELDKAREEVEVNELYDFNERKITTYVVDKDEVITILRQDEMPKWFTKGDVLVSKLRQ